MRWPTTRVLAPLGIRRPYLAFWGTLEPRKDVATLVAAFDALAADHPDLQLVVAGGSGWGNEPFEAALAASPHRRRIVRTGYVPDAVIPPLVRRSEAVVYAALEEGFGLPALEALACGAPVVTTEGSVMEEITDGAPWLARAGDAGALEARPPRDPGSGARDGARPSARPRTGGRRPLHVGRDSRGPRGRLHRAGRPPHRPSVGFGRMRALVTGGRGFVGRWLSAHLEKEGDDVVVTGEEVDVTDATAVRASLEEIRPDAVYHLAGWASVGSSWHDPAAAFTVNANGTLHVLDAARRLEAPPSVLVVSSAEVYGPVQPAQLPLTEETPVSPVSPYAASKVAAEVAARQAFLGYGLPVFVVRPFNHIGPGQAPGFVVSDLAKRIIEAERSGATVLQMGNPSPRRDLTDVRDVVRAYRALVVRGEPGETYNVCSGEDVLIGDLARRMIELSGVDLELRTGSVELRPVDVPVLRGDATRLRAATGWVPEIPLDETLRDVLDHWREQSPAA